MTRASPHLQDRTIFKNIVSPPYASEVPTVTTNYKRTTSFKRKHEVYPRSRRRRCTCPLCRRPKRRGSATVRCTSHHPSIHGQGHRQSAPCGSTDAPIPHCRSAASSPPRATPAAASSTSPASASSTSRPLSPPPLAPASRPPARPQTLPVRSLLTPPPVTPPRNRSRLTQTLHRGFERRLCAVRHHLADQGRCSGDVVGGAGQQLERRRGGQLHVSDSDGGDDVSRSDDNNDRGRRA